MKKLLLVLAVIPILAGCNKTSSSEQTKYEIQTEIYIIQTEIYIVAFVAEYYSLDYFYIETDLIKYQNETYYFKHDYIAFDEKYNYYSFKFLSAINDITMQIKEVKNYE